MIAKSEIGGLTRGPSDPKDLSFGVELLPKLHVGSGDTDLIGAAGGRMTPVSDQLWLQSCVANASGDSIELLNALEGKPVVEVSRLKIYFDGRSVMSMDGVQNETSKDAGMYIRAAFHAMNVFGVCPESDWPYSPGKVNERPDMKAVWKGLKNRIHSYYRIQGDPLDEVLSALRARHPVVFGIPVTDSFYAAGDRPVDPPKANQVVNGLHAIMAVGCVGDMIRIRNSWGTNWGDSGYALLHPGWFTEGHAIDPWVATTGMVIK